MTTAIRWSPEQLADYQRRTAPAAVPTPAPAKPRKYRNKPCIVDGLRFDSEHEAAVYQQLRARELAGEIRNLRCQVPDGLFVERQHIGDFVADFVYETGMPIAVEVVVDAKSEVTRKNPVYRLKRKLFQALHRMEIREL